MPLLKVDWGITDDLSANIQVYRAIQDENRMTDQFYPPAAMESNRNLGIASKMDV
jgi:hypothetical protein